MSCVTRRLISLEICRHTRESTQETNRTSVRCVTKVSASLQLHKRRAHSNRRTHECPYCGMMFKTNVELKSRVRIHTGAKPYSCRHCSDRFTWHHQLKTHLLKSHNEGTWLTCQICQKKFSRYQPPLT